MIDADAKLRLLEELEKTGIIQYACNKVGIARKTFYRWRESDKEFRKATNIAVKQGREMLCDVSLYSLLLLVKEKDLNAIKYALAHNSVRYRPKHTRVILEHVSKSVDPVPTGSGMPQSITDLVRLVSKSRSRLEQPGLNPGPPVPSAGQSVNGQKGEDDDDLV